MSIKQNGGVFGRNPTFNDVTIDGVLTFNGDIDVNSDLKVNGDLDVTGEGRFDGNVGINTDSPSSPSGKCLTVYDASLPRINLKNSTSGDGAYDGVEFYLNGLNAYINNREAGSIVFGTSNATKMTLGATGNLAFPSGQGIDFSATSGTGTSELLDDYEEGTWTPTILFGGANAGMTFATQTGSYTKIGNLVSASCYISLSANGSSTGAATIGGLPFAAGSTALTFTAGSLYLDKVSFANFPQTWISYANQVMNLAEVTDAGVRTLITNANFVATSEIMMNVTYRV